MAVVFANKVADIFNPFGQNKRTTNQVEVDFTTLTHYSNAPKGITTISFVFYPNIDILNKK